MSFSFCTYPYRVWVNATNKQTGDEVDRYILQTYRDRETAMKCVRGLCADNGDVGHWQYHRVRLLNLETNTLEYEWNREQ